MPGTAAAALALQQHTAKLSYEKIGAEAAAMAAAASRVVDSSRDQPQKLLSQTIASAMERSQLAEKMAAKTAAAAGIPNLLGTMPQMSNTSPVLPSQSALMSLKQSLAQGMARPLPVSSLPSTSSMVAQNHLQQAVNVQMQFKNVVQNAQQKSFAAQQQQQQQQLQLPQASQIIQTTQSGLGPGYVSVHPGLPIQLTAAQQQHLAAQQQLAQQLQQQRKTSQGKRPRQD